MAKKKGDYEGTIPEKTLCTKKGKKLLPAGSGTAVATGEKVQTMLLLTGHQAEDLEENGQIW